MGMIPKSEMALSGTTLGEQESSIFDPDPTPPEQMTGQDLCLCLICFEHKQPEELVEFVCWHNWCRGCVRQQAHYWFPPTCCERALSEKVILQCISAEEMETIKLKLEERTAPLSKRWYCPDVSCGKWIPPKRSLPGLKVLSFSNLRLPILQHTYLPSVSNSQPCRTVSAYRSRLDEAACLG
ncbi:hypothetical protein BDW62DRAFT_131528 [Aspergillus aurantiobrunneus]